MLRANDAEAGARTAPQRLWRGSKNVSVPGELLRRGELLRITEIAMSSCTHDLQVAARFATSSTSMLFLVNARTFMQHGADLEFLSTAPWEREVCYPPCTYFKPTGATQEASVQIGERSCTCVIVEVTPHL